MPCRRLAALLVLASVPMVAASAFAQQQQPPQQQQAPQQQKEEKTFPKDSSWTLRMLNGKPLPSGMDATMRIDGQFRGSGFAGCNNWSATMWPIRGQRFAVGPVALTKKSCAAPDMQFEQAFLRALHTQPVWDIANGLLEVKGPGGTLTFARGL